MLTHGTRLSFERRFGCGFYPIVDGKVVGERSIGKDTAYAALRDYFANYAWPGGYAIEYAIDGDVICGTCATKVWLGCYSDEPDSVVDAGYVVGDVYYESRCQNCNTLIAEQNVCDGSCENDSDCEFCS